MAETSTTVATAAGSIYRKSDLAKSTIPIKRLLNTGLKVNQKKTKTPLDNRRTDNREKFTEEEVTETTFHRTCKIRRGALDKSGSESMEEDNAIARAVTWCEEEAERET